MLGMLWPVSVTPLFSHKHIFLPSTHIHLLFTSFTNCAFLSITLSLFIFHVFERQQVIITIDTPKGKYKDKELKKDFLSFHKARMLAFGKCSVIIVGGLLCFALQSPLSTF